MWIHLIYSCKPPSFTLLSYLAGWVINHIYCLPRTWDFDETSTGSRISHQQLGCHPGPRDVGRLMPRVTPCVLHMLCLAKIFVSSTEHRGFEPISATRESRIRSQNCHPILNLDSGFGPLQADWKVSSQKKGALSMAFSSRSEELYNPYPQRIHKTIPIGPWIL